MWAELIMLALMIVGVVLALIGHFYEPPVQTITIPINPMGDLTPDDIAEISKNNINVIILDEQEG